ncbi:carboxymuconolactone decarboxylase family protein [Streptacidiphilus neutrinimicus]|uniref:carboxymuconolactone decarboxylase family protein n=1 Tax=Streptacidiphilus neutrinimicus TaxID=105420 RepID=UPI0034E29B32
MTTNTNTAAKTEAPRTEAPRTEAHLTEAHRLENPKITVRVAADKLAPAAMRAMVALDKATAGSDLEPGLKELVRARASQLNGCAYCVDTHSADALAGGEDQRRLLLLPVWRGTGLFPAASARRSR